MGVRYLLRFYKDFTKMLGRMLVWTSVGFVRKYLVGFEVGSYFDFMQILLSC